jgi:ADP-ribosylation factor-binding protein GGA
MELQSGASLAPNQLNGITQIIRLAGVQRGSVKMRWKLSYQVGGTGREETGEVGSLGVE